MNKILGSFIFVASVAVVSAFTLLNTSWLINPDYTVKFSGRGATGVFTGLKGVVEFDSNALQHAKMEVSVDAATIQTGNNKKNKDAKSESWFNAAKYSTIQFSSTNFTRQADHFLVQGVLDLHGIQKPVEIPFTFSNNVFIGNFKIKRKDFGIYGAGFSFLVGDEYEVNLRVPVTRK